jgi:hypothetical protein
MDLRWQWEIVGGGGEGENPTNVSESFSHNNSFMQHFLLMGGKQHILYKREC